MSTLALGLIETRGLVAAIEAADAAAKAATVTLVSAELLGGGIVTLRIRGDLGAVQAAVEAGAQAAKRIGEVLAVRVIPRPVDELERLAPSERFAHAEQDKSMSRHKRVSVRTPHDAPSGARAEKIDIGVPHSETFQSRSKEATASKKVGPGTPREETTRQTSTPTRPVPATMAAARPTPATIGDGRASLADLEAMPVVKLRQYARSIKNLPLQGRQISMANKTQLLEAIKQAG
jgi:ethanolamine utilization protein EutM